MNPTLRRVAARFALEQAMAGYNPPIPAWVFQWGEQVSKTARGECPDIRPFPCPHCGGMVVPPPVMTDEDTFRTARESVEMMLPTFQALLKKKFRDTFHLNSSAEKTRVYYFFAPNNPLENVAVQMMIKNHRPFMSVMYAPVGLRGAVDYKNAIEQKGPVEDPEMAGLQLMRLGHQVLSRV